MTIKPKLVTKQCEIDMVEGIPNRDNIKKCVKKPDF